MAQPKNRKITVADKNGDLQKVLEEAMERELYRSYYANLGEKAKLEAAGWRQIGLSTSVRRDRS